MSKNLIVLGVIVLFIPLFILIAMSSLWQGEINLVESFPGKDQKCIMDHDCAIVRASCREGGDFALARRNLDTYRKVSRAACMNYEGADTRVFRIPFWDVEAFCREGICATRPITRP
jgi:hypothetical protein